MDTIAVVCEDLKEASVESVPRPESDDGEVLIEVDRVQLSVIDCLLHTGEQTRTMR